MAATGSTTATAGTDSDPNLATLKLYIDTELLDGEVSSYDVNVYRARLDEVAGPNGQWSIMTWKAALRYAHQRFAPVNEEVNVLYRRLGELSDEPMISSDYIPKDKNEQPVQLTPQSGADDVHALSIMTEADMRARVVHLAVYRQMKEWARARLSNDLAKKEGNAERVE